MVLLRCFRGLGRCIGRLRHAIMRRRRRLLCRSAICCLVACIGRILVEVTERQEVGALRHELHDGVELRLQQLLPLPVLYRPAELADVIGEGEGNRRVIWRDLLRILVDVERRGDLRTAQEALVPAVVDDDILGPEEEKIIENLHLDLTVELRRLCGHARHLDDLHRTHLLRIELRGDLCMLLIEVHQDEAAVEQRIAGACVIEHIDLLLRADHIEEVITNHLTVLIVVVERMLLVCDEQRRLEEQRLLEVQLLQHIRLQCRLIDERAHLVLPLRCQRIRKNRRLRLRRGRCGSSGVFGAGSLGSMFSISCICGARRCSGSIRRCARSSCRSFSASSCRACACSSCALRRRYLARLLHEHVDRRDHRPVHLRMLLPLTRHRLIMLLLLLLLYLLLGLRLTLTSKKIK